LNEPKKENDDYPQQQNTNPFLPIEQCLQKRCERFLDLIQDAMYEKRGFLAFFILHDDYIIKKSAG